MGAWGERLGEGGKEAGEGGRLNIAAARAVDREFNYNFGSNLGLLYPGGV